MKLASLIGRMSDRKPPEAAIPTPPAAQVAPTKLEFDSFQDYDIVRYLNFTSQPLLIQKSKLLIYWSPRCACTKIVVWYLRQVGLLSAANFFSGWPHDFRVQFLYRSNQFKNWQKAVKVEQTQSVKFVRHPFQRAVSSYRHILMSPGGGPNNHHAILTQFLGRRVSPDDGVTFKEYLDYCEARMAWAFDHHHRVQYHPLERILPAQCVYRLEDIDLGEALNQLATKNELPDKAIENNPTYKRIDAGHKAPIDGKFAGADVSGTVFSANDARQAWPGTDALLTDATKARIRQIFALDFEAYYPGDA